MVNVPEDGLFCKPERRLRRLLRQAVNLRSVNAFQNLIAQGCDVNMVMSQVRGDTLLMYSVKRGSLEMVELLLCFSSCALDKSDRTGKSPLDEALSLWMLTAMENSNDNRQTIGRRHRILKRLLSAGAHVLSIGLLSQCIGNARNIENGKLLIDKLCKTFASNGNSKVKGILAAALMPLKKMSGNIKTLFLSGAEINFDQQMPKNLFQTSSFIPIENVIIVLCATSCDSIVELVNSKIISDEYKMFKEWNVARHVFKLICLLGKQPSLLVINHLFYQQPAMYKWYVQYRSRPPPLKHLARLKVRQHLRPNVMAGSKVLHVLPSQLRNYMVFKRH